MRYGTVQRQLGAQVQKSRVSLRIDMHLNKIALQVNGKCPQKVINYDGYTLGEHSSQVCYNMRVVITSKCDMYVPASMRQLLANHMIKLELWHIWIS